MKKHFVVLASAIVAFTLVAARAQPGSSPAPDFDTALMKLFGNNSGFSAIMDVHTTRASGDTMSMTGNIALLDGNSRFEMDMANMQGGRMSAQTVAHMKQMGMSKMVAISRRDKKLTYLIYPDMQAYMEQPTPKTVASVSDYKSETTKLGQETIDGHPCIKNKVVVTAPDGAIHESTVWNATDLKNFPIKIQMSKQGVNTVMLYKDIKMGRPAAGLFDPPANFKKCKDMMSLMMNRSGGMPPR
jgi:hypothetical protein